MTSTKQQNFITVLESEYQALCKIDSHAVHSVFLAFKRKCWSPNGNPTYLNPIELRAAGISRETYQRAMKILVAAKMIRLADHITIKGHICRLWLPVHQADLAAHEDDKAEGQPGGMLNQADLAHHQADLAHHQADLAHHQADLAHHQADLAHHQAEEQATLHKDHKEIKREQKDTDITKGMSVPQENRNKNSSDVKPTAWERYYENVKRDYMTKTGTKPDYTLIMRWKQDFDRTQGLH